MNVCKFARFVTRIVPPIRLSFTNVGNQKCAATLLILNICDLSPKSIWSSSETSTAWCKLNRFHLIRHKILFANWFIILLLSQRSQPAKNQFHANKTIISSEFPCFHSIQTATLDIEKDSSNDNVKSTFSSFCSVRTSLQTRDRFRILIACWALTCWCLILIIHHRIAHLHVVCFANYMFRLRFVQIRNASETAISRPTRARRRTHITKMCAMHSKQNEKLKWKTKTQMLISTIDSISILFSFQISISISVM